MLSSGTISTPVREPERQSARKKSRARRVTASARARRETDCGIILPVRLASTGGCPPKRARIAHGRRERESRRLIPFRAESRHGRATGTFGTGRAIGPEHHAGELPATKRPETRPNGLWAPRAGIRYSRVMTPVTPSGACYWPVRECRPGHPAGSPRRLMIGESRTGAESVPRRAFIRLRVTQQLGAKLRILRGLAHDLHSQFVW